MSDTEFRKAPKPGRWVRVYMQFAAGQSLPPTEPPNATIAIPVVAFPNEFAISPNGPRRELKTIGKCIYCGANEFDAGTGLLLSEEHFVTEGLGSRLVLLQASCKQCAKKTGEIERMVLRGSLLTPRLRLGTRRKKRKRSEIQFPVPVAVKGQGDMIFHTSLEDHPSVLFLPFFNPPGLMIDRPIGETGFQGGFLKTLTALPKPAYPEFASPPIDTAAFCQLVAKVAHGFAVSELGIDGFTPLLPDLILKDFAGDNTFRWFHLIGGNPSYFAPSEAQHVLGWGFFQKEADEYLIVWLRLLANEGAPVYCAVAGTLTPTQSARAHAAAEARARARGTPNGQPQSELPVSLI